MRGMADHESFGVSWRFGAVAATCVLLSSACGSSGSGGGGAAGGKGGTSSGGTGGSSSGGKGGSGAAGSGGTGGTAGSAPVCNKPGDMPLTWARAVARGGSSTMAGVALATDDTMRMAGSFTGATLTMGPGQAGEVKLEPALGNRDAWVAGFDAQGGLTWARRMGGTANDEIRAIAVADDGSARVAGTFEGTAVFGSGEPKETQLVGKGKPDFFLASVDASGALLWARRAGPATSGGGGAADARIRLAKDGTALLLGGFSGSLVFGAGEASETTLTASNNVGDMFLAKYSPSGALVWVKQVGGSQLLAGNNMPPGWVNGAFLDLASDGSAWIVVGYRNSTGSPNGPVTFALGEPEETKLTDGVRIGRYDGNGKLVSAKSVGGEGVTTGFARSADGSWEITGIFGTSLVFGKGEANETTLTASTTSPELFLAKFDAGDKLSWLKQAKVPWAWALGTLPDGTTRVLGSQWGGATFGPGELGAVALKGGRGFIASYAPDGSIRAARPVSETVAGDGTPHATFANRLAVSPADGSVRVAGELGTTQPATFGKGEPSEIVIDDATLFAAKYALCP